MTDDLTSATDGAVAFAEAGWTVRIARGLPIGISLQGIDLLTVDVASRASSCPDAVLRVSAAGRELAHVPVVVKQFDSTLRGHPAGETLALLRATGRSKAIVAPAFPAAGRTTLGGMQFVDGLPVHESQYAHDPRNPVLVGDVRALFEREGVSVGRRSTDSAPVIVLDSETEADLDRIAAEHFKDADAILAGSTGLLRALARLHGQEARDRSTIPAASRVLIAVGSVNAQSRQQLDVLRRSSVPVIDMSAGDDPAVAIEGVSARFERSPAVAFATTAFPADPCTVIERFSLVVAQLIERAVADALIVTGGETMAAILDRIGAHTLSVCREIEPGIPLCVLDRPRSVPLVSKAGGFGSREVFLKALGALGLSPGAVP